jgi:hypothetical protein
VQRRQQLQRLLATQSVGQGTLPQSRAAAEELTGVRYL